MKGLLFGGCSFTWGQGLYYYSNLEKLPILENDYSYHPNMIRESHLRYKDTIRYPRLVANHFNTFEVVKDNDGPLLGNGGSEDETFDFFDDIFENKKRFFYDDFDYMIIQLSYVYRNKFFYTYNNSTEHAIINPIDGKFHQINSTFNDYYVNDHINFDSIVNDHLNQQFNRLKNKMLFYENKGIKTKIISWQNDLLEKIFSDDFTKERYIKMEYGEKIVNTIEDLMRLDNNKFKIESDTYFSKKILDNHPSKYCHEIIAKSIIKNLK
jgi:hypothetical protein